MIGRPQIFKLLKDRLGPCISLYMPTRAEGPATQDDVVRYQNLLAGVENDLILRGYAATKSDELLTEANALIHNRALWQLESEGLAVFVAPDFFVAGRLSCSVWTEYRIGRRFLVRPLLPLVDATRRFYILALDQDAARFFEATPHSMVAIQLGDAAPTPAGIHVPSMHSVASGKAASSTGWTTSARHGRASISSEPAIHPEPEDANLMPYLRSVDRQVHDRLRDERAPLVLACVGFLASLYEAVNSYACLLPVKIPGSPMNWTSHELHAHAVRIVQPYLERERIEAQRRFDLAEGAQLATKDLATIVAAADEGRVDTLFLAGTGQCNEDFESDGEHVFYAAGGDDLMEMVAAKTLLAGGSLCILEKGEMPAGRSMAAILRPSVVVSNP